MSEFLRNSNCHVQEGVLPGDGDSVSVAALADPEGFRDQILAAKDSLLNDKTGPASRDIFITPAYDAVHASQPANREHSQTRAAMQNVQPSISDSGAPKAELTTSPLHAHSVGYTSSWHSMDQMHATSPSIPAAGVDTPAAQRSSHVQHAAEHAYSTYNWDLGSAYPSSFKP